MTDESGGERFCSSIRWFVSAPNMRQHSVNAVQELMLALAQ